MEEQKVPFNNTQQISQYILADGITTNFHSEKGETMSDDEDDDDSGSSSTIEVQPKYEQTEGGTSIKPHDQVCI